MTDRIIPPEVVAEDRALEAQEASSSRALIELRWHWTLDESNPDKTSFAEYGRAVGRARPTISRYAQAFQLISSNVTTEPSKALSQAGRSQETKMAARAVADARELSESNVMAHRYPEVKAIREAAREAVEQDGTKFEDEVAEAVRVMMQLEQQSAKGASLPSPLQTAMVNTLTAKATAALHEANELARTFTPEQIVAVTPGFEKARSETDAYHLTPVAAWGMS